MKTTPPTKFGFDLDKCIIRFRADAHFFCEQMIIYFIERAHLLKKLWTMIYISYCFTLLRIYPSNRFSETTPFQLVKGFARNLHCKICSTSLSLTQSLLRLLHLLHLPSSSSLIHRNRLPRLCSPMDEWRIANSLICSASSHNLHFL